MAKILIADDHAIVRAGLKQFVEMEMDLEVCGEVASGQGAIDFVNKNPVDVLLLDINLPDKSGVDVLRRIHQTHPQLPVLILSGLAEEQYAVNLMRAGASGYLNKETAPEQLVAAIRTVLAGRKYISAALAQILANDLGSGTSSLPVHESLSEREFQVFCKLAGGKSVSDIGKELFLSVKTVSTYRSRILEKLNMKTNADLTYYAVKNNLIT